MLKRKKKINYDLLFWCMNKMLMIDVEWGWLYSKKTTKKQGKSHVLKFQLLFGLFCEVLI